MAQFYAETYKLSAVTTTRKGLAELGSAATVAPLLYDFTISCSGTPAQAAERDLPSMEEARFGGVA